MSSVVIKNNAARTYMFSGRDNSGCIQRIVIRPMANAKAYQKVDSKIWDLVKNQKTVEDAIDRGYLVIKGPDDMREDDEVVKADVQAKPITGDALVKGKDAIEKEVESALKDGDIDQIREQYPSLGNMIDAMVAAAVEKAGEDKPKPDPETDDDTLAENVDALLESLGDDVSEDDAKAALREYGTKKYDLKFGNSGVPLMIEKIKEAESNVD